MNHPVVKCHFPLLIPCLRIPAPRVKGNLGKMEMLGEQARAHWKIEGRVQGVFFRASAQEQAVRLGLKGWVRNCSDGSVEVVAEGERKKVEELVSWSRNGPPGAQVREVRVEWQAFTGEFSAFRITR